MAKWNRLRIPPLLPVVFFPSEHWASRVTEIPSSLTTAPSFHCCQGCQVAQGATEPQHPAMYRMKLRWVKDPINSMQSCPFLCFERKWWTVLYLSLSSDVLLLMFLAKLWITPALACLPEQIQRRSDLVRSHEWLPWWRSYGCSSLQNVAIVIYGITGAS